MNREQLITRITEEVVRALAEREAGRGAAPGGTGGRRVPADGMADLCRDLGICRLGGRPGQTHAPGLGAMIDHTVLKPDAPREDIERLCAEARENGFASVCIQPWWVPLCADLLADSSVAVCTVIGFPHGMNKPETKAFEARRAVADGATELDMVINIGALKSKDYGTVERDIRAVVEAGHPRATVKVILENAYLTDEEKAEGCALAKAAGADYVKTSTGFGPSGATVEDVALMRRVVGADMGVKAAGGIRDAEVARKMVEAGATRLGASASIQIVQGDTPSR
ncbi:MAG: deoxyribose-phosphate aldolase [Synechococcaceae cyanobacterium]|nr:deoxyribose-phosphate aldolase [Synechococcaceae cyanobacterium]